MNDLTNRTRNTILLLGLIQGLLMLSAYVVATRDILKVPEDLVWLVASTPADFIKKLVRVHEEEALNRRLSEAGLAYIAGRYSAGAVTDALRLAVGAS